MSTAVTQPVEPEVKNNQPEVDAETGKFVHIYQPRDKEGQFIGKAYRFLYTDHMDLVRQIEEAKEQADRTIHEIKTGQRKIIGEAAVKNPDYVPAPESTEEEEKKRREEFRKTFEQELGAPIDTARNDIKRARMLDEYLIGQRWAMENEANGYFICPENAKKMYAHLKEKNWAFTAANLDLVFEELRDSLKAKPQEQAPPADSTQQPPTKAEVKPQSTSFMPGQGTGTRQPNRTDRQPLTTERFRQINKMTRDQWKKLERDNPNEAKAFLAMRYPAQPQQ